MSFLLKPEQFDNVTLKEESDFLGDVGGVNTPSHHPKNRKLFIECDIVKVVTLFLFKRVCQTPISYRVGNVLFRKEKLIRSPPSQGCPKWRLPKSSRLRKSEEVDGPWGVGLPLVVSQQFQCRRQGWIIYEGEGIPIGVNNYIGCDAFFLPIGMGMGGIDAFLGNPGA